jgi:hypothetical protein
MVFQASFPLTTVAFEEKRISALGQRQEAFDGHSNLPHHYPLMEARIRALYVKPQAHSCQYQP